MITQKEGSRGRTRLELIRTILAEASGHPAEEVGSLLTMFLAVHPATDAPLSEDEYQAQLAALRGEMPGIRQWLLEGAMKAAARKAAQQ